MDFLKSYKDPAGQEDILHARAVFSFLLSCPNGISLRARGLSGEKHTYLAGPKEECGPLRNWARSLIL